MTIERPSPLSVKLMFLGAFRGQSPPRRPDPADLELSSVVVGSTCTGPQMRANGLNMGYVT